MSNKASSHLFELIKSLNKSEKRYFKLYSSRHTIGEENGYIRLFDFIDRMDNYQEDLVFMHFKGQPLLNKFSITKARLYDNILKSLDSFHSGSSCDAQLYRLIHSAEILYNKGLYRQAERILISAGKKAEKHERFNLLLEIRQKQQRLMENELYREAESADINHWFEQEKNIIDELTKYHELWHTKSLLFNALNGKKTLADTDQKRLKEMVAGIGDSPSKNSSTRVKYLHYHIQSAYYFSAGEYAPAFEKLEKNLSLLDADTVFQTDQPNLFFSLLTNYIYLATRLLRFSDARMALHRLKGLSKSCDTVLTTDMEIKYFSSVTSLELFLLIEQGDFSDVDEVAAKIEDACLKYAEGINVLRKAYIDFKVGVLCLSAGKFQKALVWINKVLNETRIEQTEEIYCFARLLSLIIHYELGNLDLLPYTITSARRSMKLRKKVFLFEDIFLKAIGQMAKNDRSFDLEEILTPVELRIRSFKDDPSESGVFEYFDFVSWMRAKIEQRTFEEVVQRNKRTSVRVA